ncbi:MAG: metallophosphoesterase family protein [Chitinophagaceae bacterium]|nr:MAG: phosphodiesterase [Bacteroidetes bacterium OLB11]MCC6448169.1 metallophosphoesterase family protein [Chitinophagaceae bacterium]HMN32873.1 metallophosphoesterase family protein [Chitinophagaceae bacterium]
MVKIGLLSDTHGYLAPQVFKHFDDVDEIWHAGDLGNIELCNALEKFKPFRAVYGNIDGNDIRIRYPDFLNFKIENVSVLMTHIGGYPPKYNAFSKQLIQQYHPHVFICGHSHILKVIPDNTNQLLHINPGASGKHGWQKINTLIKFEVDNDQLKNLNVIEFQR